MERSLRVLRVAALAPRKTGNAGQDRQKAQIDAATPAAARSALEEALAVVPGGVVAAAVPP